MKKIKLHKWSALFFVFLITAVSCNKKSFPVNSNNTDDKNESAAVAGTPVPPAVITISDEKASTNKEGELYYDDENGFRYWRYSDGKYYLDRKYDKGLNTKKKTTTRKKARKNRNNAEGSEYASN